MRKLARGQLSPEPLGCLFCKRTRLRLVGQKLFLHLPLTFRDRGPQVCRHVDAVRNRLLGPLMRAFERTAREQITDLTFTQCTHACAAQMPLRHPVHALFFQAAVVNPGGMAVLRQVLVLQTSPALTRG